MKRCKATTTRATDSIACELEFEHEGAHEGEHGDMRAVWTNPNAPYLEPREVDRSLVQQAEALNERARAELSVLELVRPPPASCVQSPSRCGCGAMHDAKADPEFRHVTGSPLAAWNPIAGELDQRFAWSRVCRECGAVYCLIWASTEPSNPQP